MRHAPYEWLNAWLSARLGELESVTASREGCAKAERWFKALLAYFEDRHLETPRQQKNYLSQVRNAIRRKFGARHPALEVVRFDEATWLRINQPAHDRVEQRNLNSRFLADPDAIVARAESLLCDTRSAWADLAVGLGVATGRRLSELLGASTKLELNTAYSVRFTGQLKRRQNGSGEPFVFEIPTLVLASTVVEAWKRLRFSLGSEALSPRDLNQRFGRQCREAASRHFGDLIPARVGEDDLYMHLFRAVYATIAVRYYCPPKINPTLYKAEIQGHRMIIDAEDPKERRSYAASRHYDDYVIAGPNGNRDGRQGLRLGLPGVEVLEVFRAPIHSAPFQSPTTIAPMPPRKSARTAPDATPAKRPTKRGKSSKPATPPKIRYWRASDIAYAALSQKWKADADEPQPQVLDRVLGFAHAARELALHLNLTPEQTTSEALSHTLTERYRVLGNQAQLASTRLQAAETQQRARQQADDQNLRKLQRQVEELTAERDALAARLIGQQRQLKEAIAQAGPRIELLPIAHRLLGLSSQAGGLAPAQLQEALMRLAMDAIAQAAGSSSSTPAPAHPSPDSLRVDPPAEAPGPVAAKPAAQRDAPSKAVTAPIQPEVNPGLPPTVATTAPGGTVNPAATASAPPISAIPAVNRHTSQADEKLTKALRYLTELNEAADARVEKWFVSESLLADLTGCFRPAVKRFVAARREQIDDLNRRHGLGSGHNRGRSRMKPTVLPELIKTFKDSILNVAGVEQPF